VVAAPYHDPEAGGFPWFLTALGGGEGRGDDLQVADEVLACAARQLGTDPRRVHSVGMSAGGLQTTQMAYRRSSYIASVATYSGGVIEQLGVPARQDSLNPVAALIFHGGPEDVVIVSFQEASETFWRDLTEQGQFAAICNHGRGHTIPFEARSTVWEFFRAHRYLTTLSPWAAGLPLAAPGYCALAPAGTAP
jgi:predicted esterase